MPQVLAYFAAVVATFALLVMLGFSVFLAVLARRINSPSEPNRHIRQP